MLYCIRRAISSSLLPAGRKNSGVGRETEGEAILAGHPCPSPFHPRGNRSFVLSEEKRASPPDCARPTACSLFLRLTTRNLRSCAFVGNSITARDTAFFTRPRGRRKNKTNKKRADDVQTARSWFSQTRGGRKFLGP